MRLLLALCTMLLFVSCKEQQDIDEYVENIKKTVKQEVAPVEPAKSFSSVEYLASDKRSPFRQVKSEVLLGDINIGGEIIAQKPRPDANRVREYLERFSLSDFVMVGTLSKRGITWGLVQDSTGTVHAVKVGDYIGENAGRVISIGVEQIDVVETVPDGKGDWMESNAYIDMQTQLEE